LHYQQEALDALLEAPGGILQLGCGKGKTCIALEMIARLGVPALVVVPDTQLLEQWKNEIRKLMDVPDGVGLIQADIFRWKYPIVLSTYATIGARAPLLSDEILRWFGIVIWDEGHHVPAPTYAASAEAFYGKRYSLTATPSRDDGLHIISEFHIGQVLYKDLTQELKPKIYFKWTGLELDETKELPVRDRSGEIHLGMLAGYLGQWQQRLKIVLDDVATALGNGRKVLVLSNSEGEIVNMAAIWSLGWGTPLFTDIPIPTPQDVGETLLPIELTMEQRRGYAAAIVALKQQLANPAITVFEKNSSLTSIADFELLLKQNAVYRKIEAELNRRQTDYVKTLVPQLTNCGFLVYKVPAPTRHQFIDTKPVVFAYMKYGKEGLDSPALDTILISTPFSSRNALQQVMGRSTRVFAGKKAPLVIFYEDNIGVLIGMHNKLRKHLMMWPHEEGGPFDYEMLNHPTRSRNKWNQNTMTSVLG